MSSHRILTLGPDNQPLWVRLDLRQMGDTWAAMIVADDELPPDPDELKGLTFFGATAGEAEAQAKAYLGLSEPRN